MKTKFQPSPAFAIKAAARYYAQFCDTLGIDIDRDDTRDTPERIAKMFYNELTAGLREPDFKFTTFPASKRVANQLVNVLGVQLHSLCSHHHLPYTGTCHVCYLPRKRLAGVSKIARLVRWIGSQPSMQEDLTRLLVDGLAEHLDPLFAGVQIIAAHSCMTNRGVREPGAAMMTTAFHVAKGKRLEHFSSTRSEFLHAIEEYYRWKA